MRSIAHQLLRGTSRVRRQLCVIAVLLVRMGTHFEALSRSAFGHAAETFGLSTTTAAAVTSKLIVKD